MSDFLGVAFVISGVCDANGRKTWLGRFFVFDGYMDDIVHVRSVRHASRKPTANGFLLLKKNAYVFSDQCFVACQRDVALCLQYELFAFFSDFWRDEAFFHFRRRRVGFRRESECAKAVELEFFDEIQKLLEVLFRFAGEADENSRPDGEFWKIFADVMQKFLRLRACHAAAHAL